MRTVAIENDALQGAVRCVEHHVELWADTASHQLSAAADVQNPISVGQLRRSYGDVGAPAAQEAARFSAGAAAVTAPAAPACGAADA